METKQDSSRATNACKHSQIDKRVDDKEDEKALDRLQKKTAKDLRDLLEGYSGEEKARILEKRYLDKLRDFNKLERANLKLQKHYDALQCDLEKISSELSRLKSSKNTLDTLSKQLQKKNKQTLDELNQTALDGKQRKQEQQEKIAKLLQVFYSLE
jgi:hypothetical protein